MKLSRVYIANFRGIQALELELGDVTVLIGENNSGKSAVLEAVRICMQLRSKRTPAFDPLDFHLPNRAADPMSVPPIEIRLTFQETKRGDWSRTSYQYMNQMKVLGIDPIDARGRVVLRVTGTYNNVSGEFETDWEFLDYADNPFPTPHARAMSALQEEVSYFYLSALRDAGREFNPRGQYWRPFLKSSTLTAAQRAKIEAALQALNDEIVASHSAFDKTREKLEQLQTVVSLAAADLVSIDAVPSRIFDMLARTQVSLGTSTGAQLPIDRHGEGTQSLAVLMLFNAFLETWPTGSPLIALEEPEAHLHPSAIRALWKLIEKLPGQKIVTSHSGDLLSEVPVKALRRLRRTSDGMSVHLVREKVLDPDEERQFDFHVRYSRGELLFARCWILVEGQTETVLLPELARHFGIDLERLGIRCVAYRHADINTYLKAADELGIRWCVLADNDQQGAPDIAKVGRRLGGRIVAESDVLFIMPQADIEEYLCACGFGAIYEAYLTPQTRANIKVAATDPDYWKQVTKAIKNASGYTKPGSALRVAAAISAGSPSPPLLLDILQASVRLAEAG